MAKINEIVISTPNTDWEFIELIGTANEDISDLSLLEITDAGVIDNVINFTGSLGDDGYFLAASPAAEDQYGVIGDLQFPDNTFTNNTATYLLVQDFTGGSGDNLDSNNDGTFDNTPWSAIADSVAFVENDGETTYATPVLGPDGNFLPSGAFRSPEDTGDFELYDFDAVGDEATPEGEVAEDPEFTEVSIMEIQGEGHTSPFLDQAVQTTGVVTAVDSNGFYVQDSVGDDNIATSDAIFVFTGGAPSVEVGNSVTIEGTVSEFFPGGEETRNLSITQISGSPTVTVDQTDVSLPEQVVLGADGRIPPDQNIDDDAFESFDPETDGIDFFESLEAMRVTVNDAVAVGPTNRFGEIFTVVDNGEEASGISDRATLNISPDDFNPEKVQIDFDDDLLPNFDFPQVNVGTQLGDVTGVISYDFGNFQVNPTAEFTPTASDLQPETTTIETDEDRLTVASYNVLNLDPNDEDGDEDVADGQFSAIAQQIVNNLSTPDIIALQEIQDNDGSEITEVSAANETLETLASAIVDAGGPNYEGIDTPGLVPAFINDDGDLIRPTGGQPGGNIRAAFLYNPERVDLVEDSVEPLTDPEDQATNPDNPFFGGRIPLAATFNFQGEEITIINNHFSSKGGSAPILGVEQPFEERQEEVEVNGSLDERQAQSQAVKEYVDGILADNPNANVSVLGDLNEFEFVSPVENLTEDLTNFTETLPENERYSFIFQGNSQSLDHILATQNLAAEAEFDIVHTNAEFADSASDHEPLLASFDLNNMSISLNPIGTFETGIFDEGAAEIVAYDAGNQRLFVVNSDATTIDILDLNDPTNPTRIDQIDATQFGAGANSVAVNDGIVAVAIEAEGIDENGKVVLFDTNGTLQLQIPVGVLPDMVTFSPDGTKILVANEGEPSEDYQTDPEGSVSIIDISAGLENATVEQATFTAFNDQQAALEGSGVRIFGPDATVAQDLEPEYITVTPDNNYAYVSLQENNALAKVDLRKTLLNDNDQREVNPDFGEVVEILPLGFKDHSESGNQLDPSDADGDGINFQTIPSLGMLQPDSIDSFEDADGNTFIITANEGDARDYDGFSEEVGLDDLLDDGLLDLNDDDTPDTGATNIASTGETISQLLAEDRLGELDFTSATGDTDDDGLIEQLYNYGGRSFSIFDEDGDLVFDSGDEFERIVAREIPRDFNADNDENGSFDSRSDAKGPEPEAIITGKVNGITYAFIGLERVGGIMVYDLSNPSNPEFVEYINNRNFRDETGNPISVQLEDDSVNPAVGDLGPEGFDFIPADESPNGEALLAVGNEVSGSTTLYSVTEMIEPPEPTNEIELSVAGTYETGIFDEGAAEIVAYDAGSGRLFVVNSDATTIDILDLSDPTNPTRIDQIDATQFGAGANSVAVNDGIVAVAIEAEGIDENGKVVLFDTNGTLQLQIPVGVLPDMVTFSPDGTKILVANEGEPSEDYQTDPEGSVSIIDISAGLDNATVEQATFTAFNDQKEDLIESGVRIFGPDKTTADEDDTVTVAQDLEPEYITVTPDNNYAYVSLQENNALAKVDLRKNIFNDDDELTNNPDFGVVEILPLGFKDHSEIGNQLDPSNEDGEINIQNVPTFGMLQPDAIASYETNGETYIITANEGDTRDYDGFSEEATLGDLQEEGLLDLNDDGEADAADDLPFADLNTPDELGELLLTRETGDTDGDGLIEQPYSAGGRSFSIFDEDGKKVFDSGDDFERIIAEQLPEYFNANNDENNSFDSRSDDKGPEPEAVTTGEIDGTPYAFIGLERVGGIMVYNVSNPTDPQFVQYINNRDFSVRFDTDDEGDPDPTQEQVSQAGDLGSESIQFIAAEDSPNGEPLLAVGNEVSGTTTVYNIDVPQEEAYTLQLFHASDLEGGVDAIDNAPNFAAIIDQLEEEFDNTLTISAGDNVIPGPFFNAALFTDDQVFNDAANNLFGLPEDIDGDGQPDQYESLEGDRGRIDMSIMNTIGFDASAIGNHEFDAGSDALASFVGPSLEAAGLADDEWIGTQFPYLSANLDFSNNDDLSNLATDQIISESEFVTGPEESLSEAVTPRLAPAAIFERGGEQIGVVGATTPLVQQISSPGDTAIVGPNENDMQALAEVLQPVIDNIIDQGVNKVILTTHLQQIALEQELIGELSGVDIVIAGGSDTLLADETDTLRAGDEADDSYPLITENADGDPAAIVSTDGEYSYVGRLVAEFDANGILIPESIDPEVSGAFATTDEVVAEVAGNNDLFAEGTKGAEVQTLVESVETIVNEQDGNVFGQTDVFIDGRREEVRTEETNLGNLTADANLALAQSYDDSVVVSIKNGGGIRSAIGEVGDNGELLPPQANPDTGKQDGQISQLDIVNSLRFNNGLTLLTVTAEELELLLEHGVAETEPGATPGQFPQVGGLSFSFDPTEQAIDFDDEANVITEGERIQSLSLLNEDGNVDTVLVEDGDLVVDPNLEIRLVTLNFLNGAFSDSDFIGGDGYPFPAFGEEVVNLGDVLTDEGDATFADPGSEQDALAEYLIDNFPVEGDAAFDNAETDPAQDSRIVNLSVQEEEDPTPAGEEVFRFFNTATGGHFYTASEEERDFVEDTLSQSFELQGTAFLAAQEDDPNATPVFRFFNEAEGEHFYTTSEEERDFVEDTLSDFVFEGIAFFAYEESLPETAPVFRFFSEEAGHFYTASAEERDFVQENLSEFELEGIGFYANPITEAELV